MSPVNCFNPEAVVSYMTPNKQIFERMFGITKLSDTIFTMLDALVQTDAAGVMRIDMRYYAVSSDECLGPPAAGQQCRVCAAGATLCRLLGPELAYRSEDAADCHWLERTIKQTDAKACHSDALRRVLFWYNAVRWGLPVDETTWYVNTHPTLHYIATATVRPALTNRTWREHLPAYQAWAEDLKSRGL